MNNSNRNSGNGKVKQSLSQARVTRPSSTTTTDVTQNAKGNASATTISHTLEGYLHMKVRVGNQYQAKIPSICSNTAKNTNVKNGGVNSGSVIPAPQSIPSPQYVGAPRPRGRPRKNPLPISFAHKAGTIVKATPVVTDPDTRNTDRGSVCIHKPRPKKAPSSRVRDKSASSASSSSSQSDFIIFVRNLFLQNHERGLPISTSCSDTLSDGVRSDLTCDEEDLSIESSYSSDGAENVTAGAGTKRKFNYNRDGKGGRCTDPSFWGGREDYQNMLDFLQVQHGGDVEVAKLSIIVDLSAGRAVKTRRLLKKQRKPKQCKDRWRDEFETTQVILGDFRSFSNGISTDANSVGPYPYYHPKQNQKKSFHDIENKETDSSNNREEWQSILAFGEIYIKNATDHKKFSRRPNLCDLVSLLKAATKLPQLQDIALSQSVTQCLNAISDLVSVGRGYLAKLIDSLWDECNVGISVDNVRDLISNTKKNCGVILEEISVLEKILDRVNEWEGQVNLKTDDLAIAESLALAGKMLFLYPKSLVALKERIERAHLLRNRICEWNQVNKDKNENIKFISSLVKEANKIGLTFPELSDLLSVHQTAEDWMDRASRSLRFRVPLSELETVIELGEKIPLNTTDLLVKLRIKARQAQEWVSRFQIETSFGGTDGSSSNTTLMKEDITDDDRIKCLEMIRTTLKENQESQKILQVLAGEGARITTQMEELDLLKLGLEELKWSQEAKQLLKVKVTGKKAKIEDFYDHIKKGIPMREKLPFNNDVKAEWVLDGEKELKNVISSADDWFEKNKDVLECIGELSTKNSNRQQIRCSATMEELRQVYDKGDALPVNLGPPMLKLSRVLTQTENWLTTNHSIFFQCGLTLNSIHMSTINPTDCEHEKTPVTLFKINSVLASAKSDCPVDLDEVKELQKISETVQKWSDQSLVIVPKRSSKRNPRGKTQRGKHNINDLISLLKEASSFPVDVSEDVDRLEMKLNSVQTWRLDAQCKLKTIGMAFKLPQKDKSFKMVREFLETARSIGIYTVEEKIAEQVDKIAAYCSRAAFITPNEALEKRHIEELNTFIQQGKTIMEETFKDLTLTDDCDSGSKDLMNDLHEYCSTRVTSEIDRLEKLRLRRDAFYDWSKRAQEFISSTEKVPLSTLKELEEQSLDYPTSFELVDQVRKEAEKLTKWKEEASSLYQKAKNISMDDAKTLVSSGEKLRVNPQDLKQMKQHIRQAKNWATRVKKSGLDKSETQIKDVKLLLSEYDSFHILMKEEEDMLKDALTVYCLCCRQYDGFMIGCDTCGEWYHGACVGITQAMAERFEKFVCVRCSIVRSYKESVDQAMTVIRKWTCPGQIEKAQQKTFRKHHERLKKVEREVAKRGAEAKEADDQLAKLEGDTKNSIRASQFVSPFENQGLEKSIPVAIKSDCNRTEEARSKMKKFTNLLASSTRRYEALAKQSSALKDEFQREIDQASLLIGWCVMARMVFVPSTEEEANSGRPGSDGSLSQPMQNVIREAERLQLKQRIDVSLIVNTFYMLSWGIHALHILRKKPQIRDVESLMLECDKFKATDDRGQRIIRSILHRANTWQNKVAKSLTPIPGDTNPYSIPMLTQLAIAAKDIPFIMPEELQLWNTIEDLGCRHCICGGPSDGGFMISCDTCQKWFHGECVNHDSRSIAAVSCWVCPQCESIGATTSPSPNPDTNNNSNKEQTRGTEMKKAHDEGLNNFATWAPDPTTLWPVVGLFDTPEAIAALGLATSSESQTSLSGSVRNENDGASDSSNTDNTKSDRVYDLKEANLLLLQDNPSFFGKPSQGIP